MYPRPQIHRRIQGQRLIFHFNSLARQCQPCERRQAALRVPTETIKRWKTSASISSTTVDLVVLANQDSQGYFVNQISCNTWGPLRSNLQCTIVPSTQSKPRRVVFTKIQNIDRTTKRSSVCRRHFLSLRMLWTNFCWLPLQFPHNSRNSTILKEKQI